MKKVKLFQVDSFTTEPFSGNPAGVVCNADGLSDAQMQNIARELNNSETAFILSASSNDHDVRVRFFTPTVEVPLCGHATIAAHYIRAKVAALSSSTIVQKTGAGNLPVEIIKKGDDYEIIMTQGALEFSAPLAKNYCQQIVNALDLKNDRDERFPIQIVSAGHSKVMVGIKSRTVLHSLEPNFDKLARLSHDIGCNGYYVFTLDTDDSTILTHGRMFAPAIGINEDPVTGNANGPLGAYLVHNRLVDFEPDGVFQFIGKQGEAMGRPGCVNVMVEVVDNKPVKTKVGGTAVIVFQTELQLAG